MMLRFYFLCAAWAAFFMSVPDVEARPFIAKSIQTDAIKTADSMLRISDSSGDIMSLSKTSTDILSDDLTVSGKSLFKSTVSFDKMPAFNAGITMSTLMTDTDTTAPIHFDPLTLRDFYGQFRSFYGFTNTQIEDLYDYAETVEKESKERDAKLLPLAGGTVTGSTTFEKTLDLPGGIQYSVHLFSADGSDKGALGDLIDGLATSLLNETDRAKTAEGLLMPKSGGEFGGSVTAASLTSRNGLGLDKGDVRIGTSGNLLFTTSANAVAAYFSSDTSGDLLINTGIAGGGGIRPVVYTFDALTTSPTTGSIHICSDCMINGHRFVAVMWNGTAWTGLSGEEVTH